VTGEAPTFPSPIRRLPGASPIAKGRIVGFDLTEARAVPGVLDILTHENAADAVRPTKFFGPAARPLLRSGHCRRANLAGR
jgi:CO/xanthine dehydrogenase Mo-binding subunit